MVDASRLIFPILMMLGFASLVAAGALFLGRFLGPRRLEGVKVETYECGVPVVNTSRDRISVKYYLVAILFLLFDLEAAFLIPVALGWNDLIKIGPMILWMMGFFMFFFVLGLWYEFKVKALEWER